MAKKNPIELDLDIWVVWSHLFKPLPKLADPLRVKEALNLYSLDESAKALLHKIQQKHSELLSCHAQSFQLDKASIQSILLDVKSAAPKGQGFNYRRRFLEVIEAGNTLGRLDIGIPYVPAPLPPMPPSPFTHLNMQKRAKINPLLEKFSQSLGDSSEMSLEAWWGQVLLSAILYGALVDSVFLMELIKSLVEKSRDPQFRWVSLYPIKGKNPPKHPALRRWFIDPVTRLILVRSINERHAIRPGFKGVSDGQNVYRLISAYAKERGFSEQLPGGIKALLDGARARLHFHMPPWLVEYACDRLVSTSLPEHVWERLINPPSQYVTDLTKRRSVVLAGPPSLCGDPEDLQEARRPNEELPVASEEVQEGEESEEAEDGEEFDLEDGGIELNEMLPAQLRELGGVLNSKQDDHQKRVRGWLATNHDALLPSVRIIGLWAAEHLLAKGRGRRPKRPRTTYQMVNSIAGRLVGQLGLMDLTKLGDQEAYLEIYQTALEDTPSNGMRRIVARSLRSLHQYMESKHGAVPLGDHDIFRVSGRGNATVDANFISVDSFYRVSTHVKNEVLNLYGDNPRGKSLAAQLWVIAVLGFYCGLRRSEVLGLQIRDIDFIDGVFISRSPPEVWIEVCKNSLRELKSRAAHRLLPAFILMPHYLLEQVHELWVTRRKEIIAQDKARNPDTHNPLAAIKGSEPLFSSFVKSGKANDKDPNMERLTKALQHFNDDEGLRFHHLRHSFASWLELIFWLGEQGSGNCLPEWFLPMQSDRQRLKVAPSIRKALLGMAPTNTRSMLQVSSLMGHSGLDVTMGSYIHLSDFILGRMVYRLTPQLDIETLKSLSDYSESHLYKITRGLSTGTHSDYRKGGELDLISDQLLLDGKKAPLDAPKLVVDFKKPASIVPSSNLSERIGQIAYALNVLGFIKTKKKSDLDSFKAASELTGFSAEDLRLWSERLNDLPVGILWARGASLGSPDPRELELNQLSGPGQEAFAKATCELLHKAYQGLMPELGKKLASQKRVHALLEDFQVVWVRGTYLSIKADSLPIAKRWCWFLRELGIIGAAVVSHTPSIGKDLPSLERQREHWKSGLKLSEMKESGDRVNGGTRGQIRVDINLSLIPEEKRKINFQKITVLYGVRVALVILGVAGTQIL